MEKKADKLRDFYLLWSTQALSQLGSAITAFALTLWIYEKSGSALHTALLTICNYVPYVLMSIIAGAMTDRWDKKKTMLVCDLLAALGTIVVFVLIRRDLLQEWHLYVINLMKLVTFWQTLIHMRENLWKVPTYLTYIAVKVLKKVRRV